MAFPVPTPRLARRIAGAVVLPSLGLLWASVALANPKAGDDRLASFVHELLHADLDRLQRIFLVVGAFGLISGFTVAFGFTVSTTLDRWLGRSN